MFALAGYWAILTRRMLLHLVHFAIYFGFPGSVSEWKKLQSFKNHFFFIQVDIHAEELGNNIHCEVALHGDLKAVVEQVCQETFL